MKKQLPHEGHRERLKARFIENGLHGFEEHNILELLLFYSIPRQDTNEIAHALIDRFGSLKGVLDADFSELCTVKGIKGNSATLLKLIPQISKAYAVATDENEDLIFESADKAGYYLTNQFIGETAEVVYVMLLDNSFRLIKTVRLFEGNVNSTAIDRRKIAEIAIKNNASSIIIAHNHPNGIACPSTDDIQTTSGLLSVFSSIGIHVLEHFVVAGKSFVPIIKEAQLSRRPNSPKLKYI